MAAVIIFLIGRFSVVRSRLALGLDCRGRGAREIKPRRQRLGTALLSKKTARAGSTLRQAGQRNHSQATEPRPTRLAAWGSMLLLVAFSSFLHAQEPIVGDERDSQIRELRELVLQLESRLERLEKDRSPNRLSSEPAGSTSVAAQASTPRSPSSAAEDRGIRDFLANTTINFALDGYYAYNFNHPIGRVNLLRAYDVSSNSFSINQANLILEQAPDASAGRRFGARLDLMYGQATETLQGSATNELRPQVYRPLFEAYGTYVAPLGSGLTIDFGKWASALGLENNYNKDQINYSRSYYFNFLPFYHTGFRTTYSFNPQLTLSYWLVNGVQQTEDFNGFKSQAFLVTIKPSRKVSWNANYYVGQEQRDVAAVLNPALPSAPTQPGLPTQSIVPTPDGREHIFDSYLTFNPTPRLTLAAEGDYVVNRTFYDSSPAHVLGGAGYLRYQFTPQFALATRAEYLSDHGGLFSAITQALKENTVTAEYKFAEGFVARAEYRRDYSNHPFFLTDTAGTLNKEQNTATLGLIWWMGRKQGAW